MTSIERYQNSSFTRTVYFLTQVFAYIFVLYAVTDLRKGGDLKYSIPYVSLFFSLLYLIQKKDFHLFRTPLFRVLTGYILVSYLLVPLSFKPWYSFFALNAEVFSGFSLFISIYAVTRTWESANRMVLFFIALLFLVVSSGYMTFFNFYSSPSPIVNESSGHMHSNINSPIITMRMHHNGFAMVINLLFPFVVAFLLTLNSKDIKRKVAVSLIAILSLIGLLLSLSRGGWISLMVTILLWGVFILRKKMKLVKPYVFFVAAMIAFFFIFYFSLPSIHSRIFSIKQDIKTLNQRTAIWHNEIEAIKGAPFVGWGYGNKIVWYKKPLVLDKENESAIPQEYRVGSHNMMLHVLFSQGIIGLIFFLLFILVSFLDIVNVLKMSTDEKKTIFFMAILCAFVSVFICQALIEVIPFLLICLITGYFSGLRASAKIHLT
jgi:O-antigen ligase